MAITSLETHYAGCRFRSRLEARWAVFLDECGIEWEYEPEGLSFPGSLVGRKSIHYLPDFRLDTGQWAEVKGTLDLDGARKMYACAFNMTRCGLSSSADLVVLGRIPRAYSIAWPSQLHHHGGHLWALAWSPEPGCPMSRPHVRIFDDHSDDADMTKTAERLVKGFPWSAPEWAEDGLDRARMARFEWGESG